MTLPAFKNCDNRYHWKAYIRFGLYYVFTTGERTNFCDIHVGGMPDEVVKKGVYSGPKDSANKIKQLDRSNAVQDRFHEQQLVSSFLELEAGGWVNAVYSKKLNRLNFWLFGPLLFAGAPYGSLVVEMEGLELSKHRHEFHPMDKKTGQARETTDPQYNRFQAIFPKSYSRGFKPAKMLSSTYSAGRSPKPTKMAEYPLTLMETLANERAELQPAILPYGVSKVIWKVEDFADELTECQLYDRQG